MLAAVAEDMGNRNKPYEYAEAALYNLKLNIWDNSKVFSVYNELRNMRNHLDNAIALGV